MLYRQLTIKIQNIDGFVIRTLLDIKMKYSVNMVMKGMVRVKHFTLCKINAHFALCHSYINMKLVVSHTQWHILGHIYSVNIFMRG